MQESEQPQNSPRDGNTSSHRIPIDSTGSTSNGGSRTSRAQGPYTSYASSRQRTASNPGVSRSSRSSRSTSNFTSPRQLPEHGPQYAYIAGAIVGILAILINVLLTLSNGAAFRRAASQGANVAFSTAASLAGLSFLNLLIIAVMLLVMGFIVGRVAVRRRLGFIAGAIAGILASFAIFLERYIPNYPSNTPTSSATNVATLIIALILIIIAAILAGLVSLFGAWIATRRHPYYEA